MRKLFAGHHHSAVLATKALPPAAYERPVGMGASNKGTGSGWRNRFHGVGVLRVPMINGQPGCGGTASTSGVVIVPGETVTGIARDGMN
jgi:hypothetical protein